MHIDEHGNVTPEFAKLLLQVAEGFPTANLSEGMIRIYAWALDGYSIAQLRVACFGLFRTGSGFFPTTVEILRALGAPVGDDAALVAWARFRQAAFDVGAYRDLEVADATAGLALADVFGSWGAYCEESEGPGMTAKRAEFLAAYRSRRGQPEPGSVVLPGLLPGHGTLAVLRLDGAVMFQTSRRLTS